MPDTNLEKRVSAIEKRNKKVELDKAWEGIFTRRGLIILLTYLVMSLVMNSIGVKDPMINAIIPTLGFTLSTLSLPYFKTIWMKYIHK